MFRRGGCGGLGVVFLLSDVVAVAGLGLHSLNAAVRDGDHAMEVVLLLLLDLSLMQPLVVVMVMMWMGMMLARTVRAEECWRRMVWWLEGR